MAVFHGSSSTFHFPKNTTVEQYQKDFVDISKHIETLLHLPVVTREAAGLIKLATKYGVLPCARKLPIFRATHLYSCVICGTETGSVLATLKAGCIVCIGHLQEKM